MNAESEAQDPELSHSHHQFIRLPGAEIKTDQRHIEAYNEDYPRGNPFPVNPTTTSRNKRKNFNPRYTSTSPSMGRIADDEEKPPTSPSVSRDEADPAPAMPAFEAHHIPPWMQMFHHYNKLFKASEMAQYRVPPAGDFHAVSGYTEMTEWVRKFGTTESAAVSAIRDLLRAYQGNTNTGGGSDPVQLENGRANTTSSEPEPPTPPITPHACSSSRSQIPNGSSDSHRTATPPAYRSPRRDSPIKTETLHAATPPPAPATTSEHDRTYFHPQSSSPLRQWGGDTKFLNTHAPSMEDDTYPTKPPKLEVEQFNNYHDDSSDYGDPPPERTASTSQWCGEDFAETRRIKSECDETTDTTVDNNPYDDEDYPPSPNDFPDSGNDEMDDDDSYSVSLFCEDDQSAAEDQVRVSSGQEEERTGVDGEEYRGKEEGSGGGYANTSSKISVKNLGGFFDQGHLNTLDSKLPGDLNDKGTQNSDFARSMRKFASHLECQTEMCRLESLREHYHCYDFPCFGKVLSKKEEVIRHVKWHRKRMESLNHGFMRFSSSDDCSTTFGVNCQHNRKQTHYHCFQPNCDRVYISTSDVQMHSNFHRKDSAIHKEGFQRFRANEKCSADYCMFADQKTTHFHCRRDNCRYTFKNKADMEKHKTYHIKDLKLARDGFKKFLKNEACPYKQCRFSKVCNHIHCARENCFYVLHSSGQLLSHKRKHERMDNEQTYCRYKMLAVKAALLGKAAAAASPFSLTNSLLQLKKLEIDSPQKDDSPSPSPSALSMEFFQQMKKRHEEILKQNHHDQPAADSPEISLLPVIQHTPSPQTDHSQLTPSVIQQFFTAECPASRTDVDEPMNLKSHASTADESSKKCSWSEPHLHCILKDCKAVVPDKILDISSHIRLHGYSRDGGTPTAASEPFLSPGAGTSNNPMQITTIDGFFNRKRGRPPKNRFVEVYKNAQQSPQAIFTSFKLEKQPTTKDCSPPCDSTLSPSYIQPPPYIETPKQKAHSTEEPRASPAAPPVQTPVAAASQFTIHKANEHCGATLGGRCSLAMQHHYHCTCSPECTFITVERDLLSVHLERQHTVPSLADTISSKFKRFDRTIGLDCGITECRLRKTRPHLHCRQCYRQISPFDLETHVCGSPEQRSTSPSPTKTKTTPFYGVDYRRPQPQAELTGENFTIHSMKDFNRLPSVTFSTLNELRRKVSEIEPETTATPKKSHEDEKVLVVRAAGTYFPENTNELCGSSSLQVHQKSSPSDCLQTTPTTASYCSTPYCKMKRKPHEHCEFCDQSFVDSAKSKAHRLRHIAATAKPPYLGHFLPLHSTEETSPTAPQPPPPSAAYDDQPQDLSVSPNQSEKAAKPNTYAAAPTASPLPPTTPSTLFAPDLMCSISMQNFQLAQLASLYQHNPYYYQHFYPFLRNASALARPPQHCPAPSFPVRPPCGEEKPSYLPTPAECPKPPLPNLIPPAVGQFPFLSPLLMPQETLSPKQPLPGPSTGHPSVPHDSPRAPALKRKLANGTEDLTALIDALSPSTKKQMQFAAGLAAAAAAASSTSTTTAHATTVLRGPRSGCPRDNSQPGQHFKIKDEQIPTGYLKYRFNEDCYFPKCGYRNHQSHFHCDRNDCHYSFCDKTRFVQHTARHERLDKLMGNDFRQYRANMNCGYQSCPYFKNLGSANKSSHFHCLKCDFICSDTNKVVAHRRQHSKMEYIRMAGFRKVTNSEKCNSTFEATVPTSGNEPPGTMECSYSQKQTHYHCLVCDVSVLSRAQLASHKHKT